MSETPLTTSDEDLVARMRSGDERALASLYDRHAEGLYSLAVAVVGDPAEAEEVVADAFLRLWRTSDFDVSRGTVGAYLTVVTRSRALDRIRARRRRGNAEREGSAREESGFSLPVAAASEAPDEAVERGDTRRRLEAALQALSEKQRTVISLAYFGGLTHSEIAERLSEPLGTVKTRLRDGMNKLRETVPHPTRAS